MNLSNTTIICKSNDQLRTLADCLNTNKLLSNDDYDRVILDIDVREEAEVDGVVSMDMIRGRFDELSVFQRMTDWVRFFRVDYPSWERRTFRSVMTELGVEGWD